MPGGLYGLGRAFYQYLSDNGTNYQVAITIDDAVAGGFGSAIVYGSLPTYPRGWKMRHVYGVSGTGIRTKVPCATTVLTIYQTGGTFSKNSVSFNTEGQIGEKRTAKS